jgi:predicted 2-oxoglutarate/Fe(II)-dependent dioxygenase YbiX
MKTLQISADSTKTTTERKRIDQDIYTHLNKIITKYNTKFPFLTVKSDTGYILLKYSSSDFYKMHVDEQADSDQKRTVSCVICLTDDYIGGEIAFLNKQKIFKLKKGDVLLFPSNFMFPHEVYPIVSGVRYSIVTWFR